MKYMSLARRWFFSVASIVLVFLIAISLALFLSFRNYYYGAAKMTVEVLSRENINNVFALYGATDSGFDTAAREYVETFPDKEKVGVWAISSKGRVMVSSSGFSISDNISMPDYDSAIESPEGSATWTGRLPSGEKIMASTCAYYYNDGDYGGALRFMVSMDAIDKQLVVLALLIIAGAAAMYAVLLFSGMAFIRSIVRPVKEIGETAKKISQGNLTAGIEHYPFNDEIGELCATVNDMAEKLSESDRMKSDFISTVSHELRTPLTAIRGWGETLLQIGDSDPATTKRGMEIIISEASRLSQMVEELLDFSRVSSGRLKLRPEKMDFLAELDETVFSFKERAIKEGIEITYNVPKTPAPGTGDPSRIRQVFINILDNALKYTEQGGRILVEATIIKHVSLTIIIADSGTGIAPEDLPHVKEKFYKANNTVRGSGIGLAVCDEIMKLHNGSLDINSVLGQGTTVTLVLPLDAPVTDKTTEDKTDE